MNDANRLLQLYRTDFASFAQRAFFELYPDEQLDWNWHHDLMVDCLCAMQRGEVRRRLILVPPRSFKSFICSVAWPAFLLGHKPSLKIITVSYAQPLAADLARLCLDLMRGRFYQQVFPTRLKTGQQAVENFHTSRGGYRIATSVNGTLTGRGADLIIIDDPIKAEDAMSEVVRASTAKWFRNTLRSRLNHKAKGQFLVVMQRLHQDDLAGMLLEQGWPVLKLAAIAPGDEEYQYSTILGPELKRRREGEVLHPDRDPIEALNELRQDTGSFSFAAQYQQDPEPAEGNIIQRSWLSRFPLTDLPEFIQTIQSWDTASKTSELNDYSVCTSWGIAANRRVYLLHVLRKRLTYPDLKRAVREQAALHRADVVLIEDKVSGTSLIQDLVNDGFYKARAVTPKGEKALRLRGVSAMFENGLVHIPQDAPWVDEYIHELVSFPGRHDDQVDSTTQALIWIRDTGMEPGIITYYREEVEAQRRMREEQTVRLRSPTKSSATVILADGSRMSADANGFITVTEEAARPLRLAGWATMPA